MLLTYQCILAAARVFSVVLYLLLIDLIYPYPTLAAPGKEVIGRKKYASTVSLSFVFVCNTKWRYYARQS